MNDYFKFGSAIDTRVTTVKEAWYILGNMIYNLMDGINAGTYRMRVKSVDRTRRTITLEWTETAGE